MNIGEENKKAKCKSNMDFSRWDLEEARRRQCSEILRVKNLSSRCSNISIPMQRKCITNIVTLKGNT